MEKYYFSPIFLQGQVKEQAKILWHHDLLVAYSHCYTISTQAKIHTEQLARRDVFRFPFTSEIQTISWIVTQGKKNNQTNNTHCC